MLWIDSCGLIMLRLPRPQAGRSGLGFGLGSGALVYKSITMLGAILDRYPYLLNIAVLAPVCTALWRGTAEAELFEGKWVWSTDFASLLLTMWAAVLVCSVVGVFAPRAMIALPVMQVVYKSLYLAVVAYPAIAAHGLASQPTPIVAVFALMAVTYTPWILRLASTPVAPAAAGAGKKNL